MAKAKKKKSKIQKGKMTVPADKIIIFCVLVIIVCVALLFVLTYNKNGDVPAKSEEKTVKTEQVASSSEEKKADKTVTPKIKEPSESKPAVQETKPVIIEKKEAAPKETEKKPVENKDVKPAATEKKVETPKKQAVETKPAVTEKKPEVKKTETKKETEAAPKKIETNPSPKFNFPKAQNGAQLVFLFDDGGQNLNHLAKFLELPFPITIAVLPDLAYSTESARRITASGKELMLHQPMQAMNENVNPGPGAIKPDMTYSEIVELVKRNLAQLPGVKGMNNHEGSLITSDENKMQAVLDAAGQKGVFFLDSRTTVDTKVPSVSMSMDRIWYERNGFFLDNEKTRTEFLTQLRKNLDIANKTGNVIMIAHIWSADYLPALLMEVYPELKAQGYVFKTVSTSNGQKK